MAKNQTTYTLKIDAELSSLNKDLEAAQGKLQGLLASGNAPKGLEKAFERIKNLLGQMQDKASKPLTGTGFKSVKLDLDKVQEGLSSITRLVGDFSDLADDVKITFLSDDEKTKIEQATKAMEKYLQLVAAANAKEKDLKSAEKTKEKAKSRVEKAESSITSLETKKAKKQADITGKQGQINALQGMEKVNPEKIAKLQGDIAKLKAEIGGFDAELKAAYKELENAESAFGDASNVVNTLQGNIKNIQTQQLKELKEEAERLGISLDGIKGKKTAKQIELLTAAIEEQKQTIISGAEQGYEQYKKSMEDAGEQAKKLGSEVDNSTEALKRQEEAAAQKEAFENKIKQFLGLSGAAKLLRSALRDALSTITELDATMTQMAVVTDLTVGDYWDQLPEYSQRASELGVSINDAYKAATLYYQQGLKINEVNAISAETLKLAKVAGIDAAEATDKMTAALRGFNMELNDTSAQKVADVYAELAAITAADVNEISTAMTKTASIASSAGMEFETTAAFLSQIIETTRESAETAGTAMKTVIARFQELKKDPSEIGEVDGEIVDANAIETALRSVGVSLRDAQGQFRELDDVFLELSSKWNTLDKNTQRYIATIAAGSRQQSRFIAMMQDYGRTQELVSAANNSAGASNRQFEKTMDSLEAKVEKLKNAWHEFTMGIMNSELVKFGVDVLTKFLEIINKATSGLNGLGGSITKIASLLAIFKLGSKIFSQIKPALMKVYTEIVQLSSGYGYQAGKAFAEGAEKAKQEINQQPQQQPKAEQPKPEETQEEQKQRGFFGKAFGAEGFDKAVAANKKQSKAREALGGKGIGKRSKTLKEKKKAVNDAESTLALAQGMGNSEEIAEAQEALDKANQSLKEYGENQKKYVDAGTEKWKGIGQTISTVGTTIASVGMGVSMLGGVFDSLGLPELGENFATIGNVITIVGTGLTALGPIVAVLGGIIAKWGATCSLAWFWVTLIVAAIAALIAGLILMFNAMKKNSPEGQLKRAEEAANKAAEAADKAKEAYEGLASALDSLDDKYKNLDTLTKGTEEYREAVEALNNDIMDMIAQYPELASFMKTDSDGVLRIDINSADVQQVLNDYKTASIKAQTLANATNATVSQKQAVVAADKMGVDYEKIDWSNVDFGKIAEIRSTLKSNAPELTEEELNSLSRSIQQAEKKIDASFRAMAVSASQLADTLGWSNEEIAMANRTATNGDLVRDIYEGLQKDMEGMSFLQDDGGSDEVPAEYRQALNDAITEAYGEGAVYNYEDGNGEILKNGQVVADLDNDQIINLIASNIASEKASTVYESSREGNQQLIDTFADQGLNDEMTALLSGNLSQITTQGIEELSSKLTETELRAIFDNNQKIQDAYGGSFTYFLNTISGFSDEFEAEGNRINDATKDLIGESGLGSITGKLSATAQDILNTTLASLTESTRSDFTTQLTSFFTEDTSFNDELVKKISQTDLTNIEAIDFMIRDLAATTGQSVASFAELKASIIQGTGAVSTFLSKVKEFGELYQLTTQTDQIIKKLEKSFNQYNDLLELGSYDQAKENLQQFLNNAGNLTGNLVNGEWTGTLTNTIEAAGENMASLLAGGQQIKVGNIGYASEFVQQNEDGTWGIKTDHANIDLFNAMRYSNNEEDKAAMEAVDKLLEDLNTQAEEIAKTEETAKETLEQLKELEESSRDSYNEVWETVSEVLTEQYQKQIEEQRLSADAVAEQNNQMLNVMQEQLNEQRRAREMQEKKDALTDLYAQQAYLGMDTSGANNLAMVQAEEQIAQQEQDLLDASIDQKLEQIGLDNEKAAEQRERQISLQEASLEAFLQSSTFSEKIQENVDALLNSEDWKATSIGQAVIDSWQTAAMPENQKKGMEESFTNAIAGATVFTDFFGSSGPGKQLIDKYNEFLFTSDSSIGNKIDDVANAVMDQALDKKREIATSQLADLEKKGFNASVINNSDIYTKDGKLTQEGVNAVTKAKDWFEQSGNTNTQNSKTYSSLSSTLSEVQNAGGGSDISILSEKDYMSSVSDRIVAGEQVDTYQDYLTKKSIEVNSSKASTIQSILDRAESIKDATNAKDNYEHLQTLGARDDQVNQFLDEIQLTGTVSGITYKEAGGSWVELRGTIGGMRVGDDMLVIPTYGSSKGTSSKGTKVANGSVELDENGNIWAGRETTWVPLYYGKVENAYSSNNIPAFRRAIKKSLMGYKTGGLADFTGPAWLDGTPSKPEYILNADQTERFFSLIDVLESFKKGDSTPAPHGDNYIDIDINVEKLENDYDVEQVANKIRKMLHEDAMYRNVNTVNPTR